MRKYILATIIIMAGCAIAPVPTNTTTNKLGSIRTNLVDAQSHTMPGATPADVSTAHIDVTNSIPLVDSATKDVVQNGKVIADLQQWKADEETHWLGPKAHRLARWLIGIAVALGIGWILLQIAANMEGGAFAGAINIIGHIATGGIALITKGIKALIGKLVKTTPKVLAAAAPNKPIIMPDPTGPLTPLSS